MKDFRNLDPSEYLKIPWRRRWYVLAGFVLVTVGTLVYSFSTPDVYRSQSRIRVDSAVIPQDYARPSDRSSPEEQIAGILQQVQSRSFAERLIQEFQLFGFGSVNDFSMDDAIKSLAKNIQVTSTSRNTFEISAVSASANLSQTIVKRVVDTLIQSNNSVRKSRAVETDQFVDEQLRQTEQKLLDQEEKIKQFKMANLGGLPEQSAANMNALSGLNAQLVAVENTLQQIRDQQKQLDFRAQQQKQLDMLSRSILDQSSTSSSVEKPIKEPVASNPQLEEKQTLLRALLLKYTPNHPDVVRLNREIEELKRQAEASVPQELSSVSGGEEKRAAELGSGAALGTEAIQNIETAEIKLQAETYKNEIAKREKERDTILSQIKNYQNRLNLAPALEQQFMSLSRDHEIIKQQYDNLQNKKFQAQMTTNLETSRNSDIYRVVDEANLPEKPAFPNRLQIILLGLAGGLVLGLGAAFGRELLDSSLGSEDEVTAVLKLPLLVTISEIPQKEPKRLIRIDEMSKSA